MFSLRFNDLNLMEFWFTNVILAPGDTAIISLRLCDKLPTMWKINEMMSLELIEHFSVMTSVGLSLMRDDLFTLGKCCSVRNPINYCESDRCLRRMTTIINPNVDWNKFVKGV